MQGNLNEQPLVELINEIKTHKLSGALRVQRERVRAVVYMDFGSIVGADINLRAGRLIECVGRWNIVDEKRKNHLARAGVNLTSDCTDIECAAQLVRAGIVNQEELKTLLERQATEILRPLLLWQTGEWLFDARARMSVDSYIKVNQNELLIEAARRLPIEFVAARIADDEVIKPREINDSATMNDASVALQPSEAFVLSRVDAPTSVVDLIALSGLPDATTRAVIYVLASGGLLVRDNLPRVLTGEAAAHKTAVAANHASKVSTANAPPAPPAETDDERRHSLLARAYMNDYYIILGISRSTNAATLKTAYYALAKRFHPDTFRNVSDSQDRAAIQAAFARVAQAYEILKDEKTRAAYDRKLDGMQPKTAPPIAPTTVTENTSVFGKSTPRVPETPPAHQAELDFQSGLNALNSGNIALAVQHIAEAARRAPQHAQYRAKLASLLAREEQTRRFAEAEFQHAIRLEPANADYRIMLAEFYRDIGFPRRAVGELERAVEANPKDTRLRRLLAEMQRTN